MLVVFDLLQKIRVFGAVVTLVLIRDFCAIFQLGGQVDIAIGGDDDGPAVGQFNTANVAAIEDTVQVLVINESVW